MPPPDTAPSCSTTVRAAPDDERVTGALDTIGNLLNIGGILVALAGLLLESRQRRWSVLGERGQEMRLWLGRAWRKVTGKPPRTIHVSGSAEGRLQLDGIGFVTVQKPVNPNDPLPVVLEALQDNMREMVKSSEEQQKWHRERLGERLEVLDRRIAATGERLAEEAEADSEIAARSLRLEVWGLAVALIGTGFSSLASLLG